MFTSDPRLHLALQVFDKTWHTLHDTIDPHLLALLESQCDNILIHLCYDAITAGEAQMTDVLALPLLQALAFCTRNKGNDQIRIQGREQVLNALRGELQAQSTLEAQQEAQVRLVLVHTTVEHFVLVLDDQQRRLLGAIRVAILYGSRWDAAA